MKVSLLDYGAGNVRSVRNAILAAGFELETIDTADQIDSAELIVFPGVGAFPAAMERIQPFQEALVRYIRADRPFLGICLGMQLLFESSTEGGSSGGATTTTTAGLGIIPGHVVEFDATQVAVPHIGWNGRILHQESPVMPSRSSSSSDDDNNNEIQKSVYFVHSFYAPLTESNRDWVLTSTTYGSQRFISSVQKGNVVAMQFHPEKSGQTGLAILRRFLESATNKMLSTAQPMVTMDPHATTTLTKRIVVALDVRTNDDGDLVVTKGDQYDVRERDDEKTTTANQVRNLGKPVSLAQRYYQEGADEIAFLNITSFRQGVIEDMPMLAVLEAASETIFVPLTVGGGIRSYTDPDSGTTWSALEVASRYFRAGADKVSIGSDAVDAAEQYVASGAGASVGGAAPPPMESSISSISRVYGAQAVVVSIDPKRVYVASPADAPPQHHVAAVASAVDGGGGGAPRYCWWQCTVKGGRENRDICAVTLAKAVQAMGAGEIMLNSIDMDGQGEGYDLELMRAVSEAVSIPVIASSGAGQPVHFRQVFEQTNVQAALAAGMFHRKEVEIEHVKQYLREAGIAARIK